MIANIGLNDLQRHGPTTVLSTLLADQYVLSTKARKYHWNVIGPRFNDLHVFFQKHYSSLDQMIDEVAERIRALGNNAPGTMTEFLNSTELKEQPGIYPSAESMIADLLTDHEIVIRRVRDDVKRCSDVFEDQGTGDLLTDMLRQHEHMAWMLRSLLEADRMTTQSAVLSDQDAAPAPFPARAVYERAA
jgi:starvation-inducible DNA-binding protein